MKIILNNIAVALKKRIINTKQALYLIYTYQGIPYNISGQSMLELTKLKYIEGNQIGSILKEGTELEIRRSGKVAAKYESEISKLIPKAICQRVCVKKEGTSEMKFPDETETLESIAASYLGGQELIAYHYMIFMFMFPTIGSTNRRWEKHFSKKAYLGARLRMRSRASGNQFLRIAKSKDMGVFLYATYLAVKAGIKNDGIYVKSPLNFLKEYEDWYITAKNEIKNVRSVDELFYDRRFMTNDNLNVNL